MISIREAREADLPVLLAIYNHVILNTTAVYTYQPQTMDARKTWYAEKLAAGYPVFVAEEEGEVIGFSSYGPFRAWPAYKYTVEHSVYVDSRSRGRGIGRLLLEQIVEAAMHKHIGIHIDAAMFDEFLKPHHVRLVGNMLQGAPKYLLGRFDFDQGHELPAQLPPWTGWFELAVKVGPFGLDPLDSALQTDVVNKAPGFAPEIAGHAECVVKKLGNHREDGPIRQSRPSNAGRNIP